MTINEPLHLNIQKKYIQKIHKNVSKIKCLYAYKLYLLQNPNHFTGYTHCFKFRNCQVLYYVESFLFPKHISGHVVF